MNKRLNKNPLSNCIFDHSPRYDQKAIDDHNMLLKTAMDRKANYYTVAHPTDFEPSDIEEIAKILADNRKRDAKLKRFHHS